MKDYYKVETRDAEGNLVATTYFKPTDENTIEVHHTVEYFTKTIYKVLVELWLDLQDMWKDQGYTRVITACDKQDQWLKLERYWAMFGFTDIKYMKYAGKMYLAGVLYLDGR